MQAQLSRTTKWTWMRLRRLLSPVELAAVFDRPPTKSTPRMDTAIFHPGMALTMISSKAKARSALPLLVKEASCPTLWTSIRQATVS